MTRSTTKEPRTHIPHLLRHSVEVTSSDPPKTSETESTEVPVVTESQTQYSPVKCGGNGFYQVGEGCYSFTFYRSVKYSEAEHFCNVCDHYL